MPKLTANTVVASPSGGYVVLYAGDDLPEGVTVGDHILDTEDEQPEDEQPEDGTESKPAPRQRARKQ